MPFNDLRPAAHRSPRLRILANERVLIGSCQAEVVSNNHYSADSFSAIIALGPDPWADADFWSSQLDVTVEIQVSVDGGESFVSLIVGTPDLVSLDPIQRLIRIRGRDLSSSLIESPTQETFANHTSSEIATSLAERHGLIPCVETTSTNVGRFYENDRESLTLGVFAGATTEWDLLVYLARHEAFDLFVDGNRLYFQSPSDNGASSSTIHLSDMMEVKLGRSLALGRDISFTVKTWNISQQTSFLETAVGKLDSSLGGQSVTPAQYCAIVPNLTSSSAAALARRRMDEIIRHERTIEFLMPGELALTPRDTVLLDDTGTAFDQPYHIDSIERSFAPRSGFRQYVRASGSSSRTITTTSS